MQDPPEETHTWTISELAEEAGVTRRTIHYYVSQGLLTASGSEGRGSRYGRQHLDRLRLIRTLQREHLPLADIRRRLDALTDAQVADLAAASGDRNQVRETAFEYIQSVLAGTNRAADAAPSRAAVPVPPPSFAKASAAVPMRFARPAPAPVAPSAGPVAAAGSVASIGRVAPGMQTPPTAPADQPAAAADGDHPAITARSQWERILLAPDVELHVRRPSSRFQNRAIDRLVALARQLLQEGQS